MKKYIALLMGISCFSGKGPFFYNHGKIHQTLQDPSCTELSRDFCTDIRHLDGTFQNVFSFFQNPPEILNVQQLQQESHIIFEEFMAIEDTIDTSTMVIAQEVSNAITEMVNRNENDVKFFLETMTGKLNILLNYFFCEVAKDYLKNNHNFDISVSNLLDELDDMFFKFYVDTMLNIHKDLYLSAHLMLLFKFYVNQL